MKKKVLIVDDDEATLDVLSEALLMEGYLVRCEAGAEGIGAVIRDFSPDVIVLDYLLNGINGGEACHMLKQDDETCHLPVLIFSAYPRVILSLGLYGCDEFIPKPFDLDDFIGKIKLFTSKQTVF